MGLFVALVALKLSGFHWKALFRLFATPVAVLIQEVIVVMFFPVAFRSHLLEFESSQRMKQLLLLLLFLRDNPWHSQWFVAVAPWNEPKPVRCVVARSWMRNILFDDMRFTCCNGSR